ncbi:PKD domain containing protein [Dyadobacter fermentans DSM 18053]|uniref:PKD domain containing protein n=2 Tax=Dyadobacter fermentans TaxID=94254 RepID=C6W099_DYAFD|nr:PKD domain containing protein [Dyadobacter fermentans DSM 18053]
MHFMKRIFTYILLTSLAVACQVDMPQKPVSRFKFTPENGCKAPCSVTFTSEAENAANIQWDFGDGTPLQSGDSIPHDFETAGNYQVKLIVKGIDGGSNGSTRTVQIGAPSPEAFSISGGYNFPTDIIADSKGNIYVSGTAKGVVRFGNKKTLNSVAGSDDFFVAKYNSAGQCVWLYTDGSTGDDHANAIALDSAGHVYVTGFISGPLTRQSVTAKGGLDGFVAKIKPDGTTDWFKTFGGPQNDQGRALAFFEAAERPKIYLTGTVEGDNINTNIAFPGTMPQKADGRDGFLTILSALDGNFGSAHMMQGADIQAPETITVDVYGNAYIGGAFLQSIKFSNALSLKSVDSVDAFIAKWGLISGSFLWAKRIGSREVDFAYDIEIDKTYQNVYLTGMHSGDIEDMNLLSAGDENVYLGKWSTSDGRFLNARNGFNSGGKDYHGGIAKTANGNIVISGSFTGATGRFPMGDNLLVNSAGAADIILTEVDPVLLNRIDGKKPVRDGGPTEDRVNKICITNTGYVYVAGWFYDNSTFNEITLNGKHQERNTFIARYKL